MGFRLAAVILVAVTATVACRGGADGAATAKRPATTAPRTPTSLTDLEAGTCPNRPPGSSSARFDPERGTYAAAYLRFTPDEILQFDMIHWLSGEEADVAYRRDNPDDPDGVAPNDYYIVNESEELRTARIRPDATILVLAADSDAAPLVELAQADLDDHVLASNQVVFWLTFDGSEVATICQQFRP